MSKIKLIAGLFGAGALAAAAIILWLYVSSINDSLKQTRSDLTKARTTISTLEQSRAADRAASIAYQSELERSRSALKKLKQAQAEASKNDSEYNHCMRDYRIPESVIERLPNAANSNSLRDARPNSTNAVQF